MKLTIIPPFFRALQYKQHTAIVDRFGKHSYNDLFQRSLLLSRYILGYSKRDNTSLKSTLLLTERVAFLCQNDNTYVTGQWGTWMSGAMAVPLCKTHPKSELKYVIGDSQPSILVCSEDFVEQMSHLAMDFNLNLVCISNNIDSVNNDKFLHVIECKETECTGELSSESSLRDAWGEREWNCHNAHLIYTSGTTGSPKGVATTFANLDSQINDINQAWEVNSEDKYLHVLPLHHVHGIVNALNSPLSAGACVSMLQEFNAKKVKEYIYIKKIPHSIIVFV